MTLLLGELNTLEKDLAISEYIKCCGSLRWASELEVLRPFESIESMLEAANEAWSHTRTEDWLEAFSHHPRIGEKKAEKRQSAVEQQWSAQEQAGANDIDAGLQHELAGLNERYVKRFGYIFIVCATGKSPREMIGLLKERLLNDPETEITIAAEEQRKIMMLRLRKLVLN